MLSWRFQGDSIGEDEEVCMTAIPIQQQGQQQTWDYCMVASTSGFRSCPNTAGEYSYDGWHSDVDSYNTQLASRNKSIRSLCQFNGRGVYNLCIYMDFPCTPLANEHPANGSKNYCAKTLYHRN
jgi:hypothetical protein